MKKILKKNPLRVACIIGLILGSATVSYTEKYQIRFLMPIRDLIVTPSKKIKELPPELNNIGLEFKSSSDGYYVNPWMAALKVNGTAETVLSGNLKHCTEQEKKQLLDFCDYFVKVGEQHNIGDKKITVWTYPIHFTYGLRPGWISAPAQAHVAVVLAAGARIDNSQVYKSTAREAISAFEVPVEQGGVLALNNGSVWFEEYAQPGVNPPLVLNGHMYATLALNLLSDFDPRAKNLAQAGFDSVERMIPVYDAITWSKYDRTGIPANNIYQQQLHIRLLNEFNSLKPNSTFKKYHTKFWLQSFFPFSSLQRMLLYPSRFLAILLILNSISFSVIAYLIVKYRNCQLR